MSSLKLHVTAVTYIGTSEPDGCGHTCQANHDSCVVTL